MVFELFKIITLTIGVYIFFHLIISIIRGYLRYNYYKNRHTTSLQRSIKRRMFKPLTFLYSILFTILFIKVILLSNIFVLNLG